VNLHEELQEKLLSAVMVGKKQVTVLCRNRGEEVITQQILWPGETGGVLIMGFDHWCLEGYRQE